MKRFLISFTSIMAVLLCNGVTQAMDSRGKSSDNKLRAAEAQIIIQQLKKLWDQYDKLAQEPESESQAQDALDRLQSFYTKVINYIYQKEIGAIPNDKSGMVLYTFADYPELQHLIEVAKPTGCKSACGVSRAKITLANGEKISVPILVLRMPKNSSDIDNLLYPSDSFVSRIIGTLAHEAIHIIAGHKEARAKYKKQLEDSWNKLKTSYTTPAITKIQDIAFTRLTRAHELYADQEGPQRLQQKSESLAQEARAGIIQILVDAEAYLDVMDTRTEDTCPRKCTLYFNVNLNIHPTNLQRIQLIIQNERDALLKSTGNNYQKATIAAKEWARKVVQDEIDQLIATSPKYERILRNTLRIIFRGAINVVK